MQAWAWGIDSQSGRGLLVQLLQEYSLNAFLTFCLTWALK